MRGFNKNFKVAPKQNGADKNQRRFTEEKGGGESCCYTIGTYMTEARKMRAMPMTPRA